MWNLWGSRVPTGFKPLRTSELTLCNCIHSLCIQRQATSCLLDKFIYIFTSILVLFGRVGLCFPRAFIFPALQARVTTVITFIDPHITKLFIPWAFNPNFDFVCLAITFTPSGYPKNLKFSKPLIIIFAKGKINSNDQNFKELVYGWFFIIFHKLLTDFA